jgi:hypothetical protein
MLGPSGDTTGWENALTVPFLPMSYPRQAGFTCGEANARSVIEAVGVEYERDPRPPFTVRLFGYSLLGDLESLLKAHGLDAPVKSARELNASDRLDVLRSHLRAGEPVIIAIGNGHVARGRYTPGLRLVVGHYLTIYGLDDSTRTFFVYDSYLKGEPETPLPAGNDHRTYSDTLRDWRGPLYYPLIGRRHVYIPIRTKG